MQFTSLMRTISARSGAVVRVSEPMLLLSSEEEKQYPGVSAYRAFYEAYLAAFARSGGTFSSVVATARGEVLSCYVSVKWEIIAFREGRAAQYTWRAQTWNLREGVLLSPSELLITPALPDYGRLMSWEKTGFFGGLRRRKEEKGWFFDGDELHFFSVDPCKADPASLRRSALSETVRDERYPLSISRLLVSGRAGEDGR